MTTQKQIVAIIGFGAAGMHILNSVINKKLTQSYRFIIIDPETKCTNDKTWCFWAENNESILKDYHNILHYNWDNILVQGAKKRMNTYQYYQINALDFYNFTKEKLKGFPEIGWIQESVNDLTTSGNCYRIETPTQHILVDYVLDSRLPKHNSQAETDLKQSFYGWKIQTPYPIQDSKSIHLMNFDIEQDFGCQFIYFLPDSDNTALVELTKFGTELLLKDRAEELLESWLDNQFSEYTIMHTEQGVIPMSQSFDSFENNSSRLIKIGTAGGAVKSSTGYAFYTMYIHAENITKALIKQTRLPIIIRKKRFRFYDKILLQLLKTNPEKGKIIFNSLFSKLPPDKILKFLSEKSSIWGDLYILISLPVKPFLKALLQLYIKQSK